MDLQPTGKTALVTGASRGMGLAIVRANAGKGTTVIGCARTVLPELAGSGTHIITADLATPDGPAWCDRPWPGTATSISWSVVPAVVTPATCARSSTTTTSCGTRRSA